MSKVVGRDVALTWFWPEGVPHTVEPQTHSLGQLALFRWLESKPHGIAIIDGGQVYSYARINGIVQRIRRKIVDKLDSNSRIALLSRNRVITLSCALAVLDAGAEMVMLDAPSQVEQLSLYFEQIKPTSMIVEASADLGLLKDLPRGDPFALDLDLAGIEESVDTSSVGGSGKLLISAKERGFVVHQEPSLVTSIASFCAFHRLSEADKIILAGNLVTWLGFYLVLVGMVSGAGVTISAEEGAKEMMNLNGPTLGVVTPHALEALVGRLRRNILQRTFLHGYPACFSPRLRWLASVTGAYPALPRGFQRYFFRRCRIPLLQMYGTPETWIALSAHDSWMVQDSIGTPLPSTEVSIVDPVTYDDIPKEAWMLIEKAELVVRGPTVCKGYLSDEMNRRFIRRRWLHTGDSVEVDANGVFYPKEVRSR